MLLAKSASLRSMIRHVVTPQASQQRRNLSLHEYQGQKMLKDWGIKVARGGVAETAEEAKKIADVYFEALGEKDLVLKAQVLAGGRGKGHFDSGLQGGVHICTSSNEVYEFSKKMLGHNLITKQTTAEGVPCNHVYIVERKYIRRELYLAIVMDREAGGPVLIASASGGMNIEEIASSSPDSIVKKAIDVEKGLTLAEAKQIAEALQFQGERIDIAADQMRILYKLFWENDATLIEINPFAETAEGEVMCLDAKFNFDSNAVFRHPEWNALKDTSQEDPRDVEAAKHDINYIGLDGNIACLVNGAGLAMATMDIIKLHGGSPANFLDIGGGASETQVTAAFKILTSDPNVKGILVNIFGGIMRCDIIALGIVKAAKELNLNIPVVVRLQGTNVEKGQEIIDSSGLRLISINDLDSAAERIVKIAQIMELAGNDLTVNFELPI